MDFATLQVEDATDQRVHAPLRQETFVSEAPDQEQQLRLDQRQLPIQVGATQCDFRTTRPPVATTGALPGKHLVIDVM